MFAKITAIEYYLPPQTLGNDELVAKFPEWNVHKIESKTGIEQRHIADPEQCSSDLAVIAAERLFASGVCQKVDIDYILLCTQSPDYFLPTTACVIQDRLGLRTNIGALDFNLGCSGYVYGLSLAKGLIETKQAQNVLLLTAETYSKFIHDEDKSVRTLFGDAAAATLIQGKESNEDLMGPFVFGTDGRGAQNLIVQTGGMRQRQAENKLGPFEGKSADHLYMNGREIFRFTVQSIPPVVQSLLERSQMRIEDIDCFVFHQANRYMLESLRNTLEIPPEKFHITLRNCGNTVSSTIPIALKEAQNEGKLKTGDCIMLVGFGVGYSWGATLVKWL